MKNVVYYAQNEGRGGVGLKQTEEKSPQRKNQRGEGNKLLLKSRGNPQQKFVNC